MTRIAGVSTQTNRKGIVTKITIDLKKQPQAKQPLVDLGLIAKSKEEIEREEFYKKVNDPTNLTGDELFARVNKHIEDLWAK